MPLSLPGKQGVIITLPKSASDQKSAVAQGGNQYQVRFVAKERHCMSSTILVSAKFVGPGRGGCMQVASSSVLLPQFKFDGVLNEASQEEVFEVGRLCNTARVPHPVSSQGAYRALTQARFGSTHPCVHRGSIWSTESHTHAPIEVLYGAHTHALIEVRHRARARALSLLCVLADSSSGCAQERAGRLQWHDHVLRPNR